MGSPESALRAVFGDSSSENEGDAFSSWAAVPRWNAVRGVAGLWICSGFLSPASQNSLLEAVRGEGWFIDAHNQAMRFGCLPKWAAKLSELVLEAICIGEIDSDFALKSESEDMNCPLPSHLLWREPLFDQLIANMYEPGEGICPHVDLMRFEDGIAIISLQSPCVMHFSRVAGTGGSSQYAQEEDRDDGVKIPLYLSAGSLLVMSGEARYCWKHEINRKPGFQLWEGKEIQQQRRVSITLRKLCSSPDS